MNYEQSIFYLEQEVGFASIPGLSRIDALLSRLGNPQEQIACIHIAGTNGKGSAAAMLSAILQQNGYCVGVYTSPHLHRYTERMTINGIEITETEFAEEISNIKQHCLQMKAQQQEIPTLFEVITAAAFCYFEKKAVDVVILEVGLGGRYDATNIIKNPLLSIIMSISIDHIDFLGDTVEQIAYEKAGIIKPHCPIVLYPPEQQSVYDVIATYAKKQESPLFCPKNHTIQIHKQHETETIFSVQTDTFCYEHIHLSLLGEYQIQNCITVLQACEILKNKGFILAEQNIYTALSHVTWAGRMEFLYKVPYILIDGAHNADGILKASDCLKQYAQNKKITLILGVLEDKAYDLMIATLFPLVDKAILTEPHSHRKLQVSKLAEATHDFDIPIIQEPDIQTAFIKAWNGTNKNDMIFCCGSLYMIGELREYILSYIQKEENNVRF